MNWGKGIAIVIAIYCIGILFLVYKTTSVEFELVSEDYYAKELAYQDQIDKMKNVKMLGKDVEIDVQSGSVVLSFPIEKVKEQINGELVFFRPSDGSKDRHIPISVDSNGTMQIDTGDMLPGIYNIQIEWQVGDLGMYSEETIYL